MQAMIVFLRHDDIAAILRTAGIICLFALIAIAGLASYDVAYLFPAT